MVLPVVVGVVENVVVNCAQKPKNIERMNGNIFEIFFRSRTCFKKSLQFLNGSDANLLTLFVYFHFLILKLADLQNFDASVQEQLQNRIDEEQENSFNLVCARYWIR